MEGERGGGGRHEQEACGHGRLAERSPRHVELEGRVQDLGVAGRAVHDVDGGLGVDVVPLRRVAAVDGEGALVLVVVARDDRVHTLLVQEVLQVPPVPGRVSVAPAVAHDAAAVERAVADQHHPGDAGTVLVGPLQVPFQPVTLRRPVAQAVLGGEGQYVDAQMVEGEPERRGGVAGLVRHGQPVGVGGEAELLLVIARGGHVRHPGRHALQAVHVVHPHLTVQPRPRLVVDVSVGDVADVKQHGDPSSGFPRSRVSDSSGDRVDGTQSMRHSHVSHDGELRPRGGGDGAMVDLHVHHRAEAAHLVPALVGDGADAGAGR